ncbi:hypothetical protein A2U01_0104855, partial [Trifolium medium]|nr:hypothetical protein [Trifolium medium]
AAIEDIVVGGDPFFGDIQWRMASIPIKFEGVRFVLSNISRLICFCGFQDPILGFARSYIKRQWSMWDEL